MLDATPIADNLFVGGHPKVGSVTTDDFDVLVLLARGHQEDGLATKGVTVLKPDPIDDTFQPISYRQAATAIRIAKQLATMLENGERILVTCEEGINRSPLVVAMVLMLSEGISADEAIERLREARGPLALNNQSFVSLIKSFHR